MHRFENLKTQHSISIIGFEVTNTVIRKDTVFLGSDGIV